MLQGLALVPGSAERRLLVRLLTAGEPLPLDLSAMAQQLAVRAADLAKAMFALNRAGAIAVLDSRGNETPEHLFWHAAGLAQLGPDLAALAQPGQALVLASADGLVIAATGLGAAAADVLAARVRPGQGAAPAPGQQGQPGEWGEQGKSGECGDLGDPGWSGFGSPQDLPAWQAQAMCVGAQRLTLLWTQALNWQHPALLRLAAALLQAHGEPE